jgi:hypothetical protein
LCGHITEDFARERAHGQGPDPSADKAHRVLSQGQNPVSPIAQESPIEEPTKLPAAVNMIGLTRSQEMAIAPVLDIGIGEAPWLGTHPSSLPPARRGDSLIHARSIVAAVAATGKVSPTRLLDPTGPPAIAPHRLADPRYRS